ALYKITDTGVVPGTVASGLTSGYSLTADANGYLYAAGKTNAGDLLVRVAPDGQRTELLKKGFAAPAALVKAGDGKLYVANFDDSSVMRVDAAGKIEPFAPSGLNRPVGIVQASSGEFFVADSSRVVRVSATGAVSNYVTGISSPQGLALEPSGNLLVTAAGTNSVLRIGAGGVVSPFGQSFGSKPAALAYDTANQLYVADLGGSLRRLNGAGVIETLKANGALGTSVRDIGFGPDGTLYAVAGTGGVMRYTPSDNSSGGYGGGLSGAAGVAFDSAGRLLVTESSANRITRFNTATNRETLAQSLLSAPAGVVSAADGTRYILNASNVSRIPASGRATVFATNLGGVGSDIALNPAGGVYVLVDNVKIQRISTTAGVTTRATVPASRKLAVASDGTIFLADSVNNKIHRLSPSNVLTTFAATGAAVVDLDVSSSGEVIAALADGTVQRYSSSGTVVASSNVGQMAALAAASDGSVYMLTQDGAFKRLNAAGGSSVLLSDLANASAFALTSGGGVDIVDASAALLKQYSPAMALQRTVAGFGSPGAIEWVNGEIVFADSSYGRIYLLSPVDGVTRPFVGMRVDQLQV
ncbi:MAG: hypothetical protein ACREMA_11980, partial [Longimicrobiales bacterium]